MNVFEKIIEKLEEEKFDCIVAKDYMPDVVEFEQIKNIINELVKEHNNGWIPCSSGKRPKDNQFILFTVKLERGGNLETFYDTKYGFYEFYDYDEGLGRFVISDGSVNTIPFGEVIAWQPLPEPYKE